MKKFILLFAVISFITESTNEEKSADSDRNGSSYILDLTKIIKLQWILVMAYADKNVDYMV